MIKSINPDQVNIGANSRQNQVQLFEPTSAEVGALVKAIRDLKIKVILKDNLERIYKE